MYLLTSLKTDMSVIIFSLDAPSQETPHCSLFFTTVAVTLHDVTTLLPVNAACSPSLYYHLPPSPPPCRSI